MKYPPFPYVFSGGHAKQQRRELGARPLAVSPRFLLLQSTTPKSLYHGMLGQDAQYLFKVALASCKFSHRHIYIYIYTPLSLSLYIYMIQAPGFPAPPPPGCVPWKSIKS